MCLHSFRATLALLFYCVSVWFSKFNLKQIKWVLKTWWNKILEWKIPKQIKYDGIVEEKKTQKLSDERRKQNNDPLVVNGVIANAAIKEQHRRRAMPMSENIILVWVLMNRVNLWANFSHSIAKTKSQLSVSVMPHVCRDYGKNTHVFRLLNDGKNWKWNKSW